MKKLRFLVVLWIAKLGLKFSKIFGNQNSMISGKIAISLYKDFILHFTHIDYEKVIFITGTNGKSASTNLIAHTLRTSLKQVATNKEGANMESGVATTLIKNSNWLGQFQKEFLVLEIDERWLKRIIKVLPARNLCITNLQKDQVQRNGDPDFIYQIFKKTITKDMTLFVNNEEPRSRSLEQYALKTIYYSVEKNSKSFEKKDFYTITLPCPKCHHKIEYEYHNIENIGKFKCSHCNYQSLKKVDVKVTNIDYEHSTFICNNKEYKVNYSNPFSIYNYALTIAICQKFHISYKNIEKSFKTFVNPNERREEITYHGKKIHYLRMKQENPETLQNALDTIARDPKKKAIWIGLYEIKDFDPAYTNTFYFFDCDFEKVVNNKVLQYVCFSKTVSYDTANRMIYAGVKEKDITIYDIEDDFDLIFEKLDKVKTDNIYLITGMKPYKKIKEFLSTK